MNLRHFDELESFRFYETLFGDPKLNQKHIPLFVAYKNLPLTPSYALLPFPFPFSLSLPHRHCKCLGPPPGI